MLEYESKRHILIEIPRGLWINVKVVTYVCGAFFLVILAKAPADIPQVPVYYGNL